MINVSGDAQLKGEVTVDAELGEYQSSAVGDGFICEFEEYECKLIEDWYRKQFDDDDNSKKNDDNYKEFLAGRAIGLEEILILQTPVDELSEQQLFTYIPLAARLTKGVQHVVDLALR